MKRIIISIAVVLAFSSCKKSYQCNITNAQIPEAPLQTKKFYNDKAMHQWEERNSVNGQYAHCY